MFSSLFSGEKKLCTDSSKSMQTNLEFTCDPTALWNTSVVHNHGGARSPEPVSFTFDHNKCSVSFSFQSLFWGLFHLLIFKHFG